MKTFIAEMTESNTKRLRKLNEDEMVVVQDYSPFALCNRKKVTYCEQRKTQMIMFNELVAYVAKVRPITIW